MRFSVFVLRLSLVFIAAIPVHAHAGRPMVTDDAGITETKACQLETWAQKNRGSTEFWVVPACNFTGSMEVAFGAGRIAADDRSVAVLQGKTLFKPLTTNDWGMGLVFGTQFDPRRSVRGDLYAFVPVSVSFLEDRLFLHTNLGWAREKEGGRHRLTWGTGAEWQLALQTWLSAETFGQNQGRPFYQVGARHWLVPERVQIDATYGNRFGHHREERWFSIGFKFVTVPFLP